MVSGGELAILPEELIVVTGANGFIGSHVVDQLLLAGYNQVRSRRFSLAEVPEMFTPGAFDDSFKGASGMVHIATPVMRHYDPFVAIISVVNGALEALRPAAKEPKLTRVVMTSSSTAAASPQPNKEFVIDENTWNQSAVKAAWAPPPYEGSQRRVDVYAGSKTQSEEAAWKFMKEEKPHFVLNTVLPNANMSKILSVEHQGYSSTNGWLKSHWDGFPGEEGKEISLTPPQYYINVQDNARVHVAALVYTDVKNERLFTFAHPYSWNDILAVFRKLYPQKKFVDDIPNIAEDKSKVANKRAEDLLKGFAGLPGWTSLEHSVKDATERWQ